VHRALCIRFVDEELKGNRTRISRVLTQKFLEKFKKLKFKKRGTKSSAKRSAIKTRGKEKVRR
jgi:hypothetical protein